jgi:hypothetical protein
MQGDATKTIQNALANLKKVSAQLETMLSDSKYYGTEFSRGNSA